MSQLNAYVVTFNCGREVIDADFFAAHLFDGLTRKDAPPDLITLCLQEAAPIAYSFLSTSLTARYTQSFEHAVTSALKQTFGAATAEEYELVKLDHAGMTAIMVFAKGDVLGSVKRVDTAGVGVGLWDMGNKGAVGIRLWLDDGGDEAVPVTFVAAHLAPHEPDYARRNQDWRAICQRLVFTPDSAYAKTARTSIDAQPLLSPDNTLSTADSSMFTPMASLYFAGDLNYRTSDKKPDPDHHKTWPSPSADQDEFAAMLKNDQLIRERASKSTLHLMDEADIAFPPTYKYSSSAQKQAIKLASDSPSSISSPWAEHRTPSWCDRILFLAEAAPKVHSYTALPIQPTSDHRPVALSVMLPLKQSSSVKPPFSIDKDWQSKRAAARRLEIAVGVGAYLTLTTEGRLMLAGTLLGAIFLYFGLR